ncbi:MAG: DUF1922 domain-containing protein [Candidatus Bathyarchaeota archaeon]|nr:MAG: DUF1922 domain-containing protein [Candidatus Bathyarchaeota archaeon]
MYLIIICSGCGRLLIADASTKSRKCPYCGIKVWLSKAKKVGRAEKAIEASVLVQQLKRKRP